MMPVNSIDQTHHPYADVNTLRRAREDLPIKYREVLVPRELEAMSYKEIATVIEAPVGTVMSGCPARAKRFMQFARQHAGGAPEHLAARIRLAGSPVCRKRCRAGAPSAWTWHTLLISGASVAASMANGIRASHETPNTRRRPCTRGRIESQSLADGMTSH